MARYETKEENLIYYNITQRNEEDFPVEAKTMDTRNQPIINTPDDFELSVVRFQVDINSIPILNPVIPNPAAPLTTNMSVTLVYQGVPYQEFVDVAATTLEGLFNYQTMLMYFNEAFLRALVALKTANPALPVIHAPYLYLDPKTQLISTYVTPDYLDTNPAGIQIWFNTPAQSLLAMPATDFAGYEAPDGVNFKMGVSQSAVLQPPAGAREYLPYALRAVAGDLVALSQEFYSLNSWSDMTGLVFTSSLLPINNELVPSISLGGGAPGGVQRNSLSVLTDFEISQTSSTSGPRGSVQYLPTAEYRMISMTGNNAIDTIDINVFWIDKRGILRPVMLAPGSGMNIKLMFRKKSHLKD